MSDHDDMKGFLHSAIGAVAGEVVGEALDTSDFVTEDKASAVGDAVGDVVEYFLKKKDKSEKSED